MRRRLRRTNRQGIEILELALLLPFYVMLVLGIIEFGRGFEVAQWLTASAREGARLAMLYNVVTEKDKTSWANAGQSGGGPGGTPTGNDKVETDVKNFLEAVGIDPSDVTVDIVAFDDDNTTIDLDDYQNVANTYFRVRVSVDYEDIALMNPVFMGGATLAGEIVVRHE